MYCTSICDESYAATNSKLKGGYIGIMLDQDGYLLEASMANVGVVLKNGKMIIPSFERTLAGTTAISCFHFIENDLITQGIISEFSREDIHIDKIKEEACELMLFGGQKVVPILTLDEVKISSQPGLVALSLQNYLDEKETGVIEKVDLTPIKSK